MSHVSDSYVAALQHDLVEVPEGARLVGVVRRPTRWFSAAVDENRPALGPPTDLLDETKAREEEFKMQGVCDEEAHNAAWAETDFEARYREHLAADPDAEAALEALADVVRAGTPVVLVCYENTEHKRCHRTLVRAELEDRVGSKD